MHRIKFPFGLQHHCSASAWHVGGRSALTAACVRPRSPPETPNARGTPIAASACLCDASLRRLIRLRRYSAKRISAEKRRNSGGPKTSVPKFGMGWSPPVPYDPLRRLGAHGHMPHATCGAMLGPIGASRWAMDTAHTSYFGAL